jgi:carboxyl-terminal processing protease
MQHRSIAWFVALAAALVCATSQAEEADPSAVIVAVLKPLQNASADDPAVWESALTLKGLGKDAVPKLREAAASKPSLGSKLALGSALLSLHDFPTGVSLLASVVKGEEAPLPARIAAARLLGEQGRDAAEIELTGLVDRVGDAQIKVALARSLILAATTEAAEMKGTSILVRLARVGKGSARAAAVLALAELGDFRQPVPRELERLAAEPTPRGRLATKLLELQRLSKLMLRPKDYAGSLGNPLLQEIKQKILRYHVEPPRKEQELVDAAARGMAAVLHETDPYSTYFSADHWKQFREQMSGAYGGIGAHVQFIKDSRTGADVFTATKPIYSGPAYKAGLRSYDQFIEIDGQPVAGKSQEELRDLLRGLPESVVACKIRRRGPEKDHEILLRIVRGSVSIPSVFHDLLPGKIGYLRLTGFGDDCSRDIEKTLRAMEKEGMRALIFDLRGNPGGLLREARNVADKFLKDDKLIVYSEGRNKQIAPRKELRTTDPETHPDYPLALLVDGGSASASEIVAGALQDHKRALVIGTRTFGKGSVQQLMPLDSVGRQAALKLTIARYYLPSGRSIHRTQDSRGGIIPEIVAEYEPPWTPGSFQKHRAAGDLWNYSLVQWPRHRETLSKLARFDAEDPSKYPGFDAWYDKLKVKTDRDSARRVLRQWIRILVADARGEDWACDFQEDTQLQRAIYETARKLPDTDPAAIPEYKSFAAEIAKRSAKPKTPAASE